MKYYLSTDVMHTVLEVGQPVEVGQFITLGDHTFKVIAIDGVHVSAVKIKNWNVA